MPIGPDDKDWTWVLERPCPECTFDVSDLPRAHVAPLVRSCAQKWTAVLNAPPPRLKARPGDDRWSPLEYACHVRDVFRLYDERLALMLDEDDPTFANWDQDETALEHHYRDQDAHAVAAQLRAAALALANRFDGVHGDQWDRPGRRSDGASFTIETFGRYMIHDPIHHLYDVGAGLPERPS